MTTPSVTVRDVAAHAQVAVSTVSKAINHPDTVTPETLERVTAAIEQLGYVRNEAARALRMGESHAVGVLLSQASSPFAAALAEGISDVLHAGEFSALLGDSGFNPRVEADLIKLFEAQHVRGLLIAPVTDRPAGLAALERRGVPVVYLDARAPSSAHCSVRVDDRVGARLAVTHLASMGRKRVAVVRGRIALPQVRDRLIGARTAAAEAGIELTEIETSGYSVEAGLEAGAIIAGRPMESRPDGVFAINDLMAMGVVSSLIDRGFSLPRDVAVVGFDDVSVAAVARLPLTTIRQPAREMGSRAAHLLVEEMHGGPHDHEHTVFLPELVIRASTVG